MEQSTSNKNIKTSLVENKRFRIIYRLGSSLMKRSAIVEELSPNLAERELKRRHAGELAIIEETNETFK